MPGKRELKITIAEDGSVQVKVQGVAGQSCLGETKFLEDAMGGSIKAQETTEEFYLAEVDATVTTEQG